MGPMKQLALDIGLAPEPTLARFFVGANAALLQHLRLALESGHSGALRAPVPVYLWGEPGCGKTHLLRAVHEALREQGLSVGWMDASTAAQRSSKSHRWAVLLDEVHLFDLEQQALAFNWFINALNPAHGMPRWVLAAGDVPPADLPLREDLRSRLGWGHVFQVRPLDEDARRAVLRQEAAARGLHLGDDVMDYMLRHFSRDLGSLMQLLDHLDSFALRAQRALTIPLLKTMLKTE